MKAMRKLIPALAMLLVSAVVMSSASFAWFTMSRQVTAQGMNVTVTAPNNLLIKATGTEEPFAEISTITGQNILLVPASTNSGKVLGESGADIYVVKDGQALDTTDGSLFMTTPDGKQTLLEKASLAVGNATPSLATPGGYYDFKYTIKTEGGTDVNVVVNSITVTNNASGKSTKPVRVAVMTSNESLIKIYKPDDTAYNHLDSASKNAVVGSIDAGGTPTLVVDGTTKNTSVDPVEYTGGIYTACAKYKTDTNYVAQLTSTNSYTQDIIVRVWYEGQDTECVVSTGANAKFDVKLVLADVASLDAQPVGP